MTQQIETTLDEWSGMKRLKPAGFGLYTKFYILVAAYFIFQVMAAYGLNALGVKHWNWVLMGLVALLDLYVLFSPVPWLAIAGAGFAAGQPGGEKGFDTSDGIDKVKEWVPGVYRFAVRTIIGSKAIFILLALLPVAGNQGTTAIILGTVLPVIIGSSIADEAWKGHPFTRTVYLALCWLLTGSVVYWAMVTVWPELRPFKAKAITTQVEEEIRRQHETVLMAALNGSPLGKKGEAIKEKMLAMPPHLTVEERLALLCPTQQERKAWEASNDPMLKERLKLPCLTPEERKAWDAANSNVGERALHGLKQQAGKIGKKFEGWSKDGSPATAAEAVTTTTPPSQPSIKLVREWDDVYTPSATTARVSIGHFVGGTYCLKGQVYHEYRLQWIPVDGREYKMTYQGKYVDYGYQKRSYIPESHEAKIPFPGEPYAYGAVFIWVGDQKVYAADGRKFTVPHGTELWLDVNLSTDAENRRSTSGHKLQVERC